MTGGYLNVRDGLPSDGAIVHTLTPTGDDELLLYRAGKWWVPDGSMLVTFTPLAWRA